MSAEPVHLMPVDRVDGGHDIPAEILRFASLPQAQRNLLMHVSDLLSEIAYGTVVMVLQDGKVIQIETSEKVRLR